MTIPTASDRFVIDSSGWVEFLGGGPKEPAFAPYFDDPERILLPAIVIYEVHRKILREQGKTIADLFISQAFSFGSRVIDLDLDIAVQASAASLHNRLHMADAVIYATAQRHRAELITADAHFQGLAGVLVL